MKKFTTLAALIAALTLSACSAPAVTTPAKVASPEASTTATIAAAPIPAAAKAVTTTPASAGGEDVALFLKSAKARWPGETPSDADLVAAGKLACVKMRAGTDVTEVQVVTGGTATESLAIAVAAQDGLCRDMIAK